MDTAGTTGMRCTWHATKWNSLFKTGIEPGSRRYELSLLLLKSSDLENWLIFSDIMSYYTRTSHFESTFFTEAQGTSMQIHHEIKKTFDVFNEFTYLNLCPISITENRRCAAAKSSHWVFAWLGYKSKYMYNSFSLMWPYHLIPK